MLEGKTYIVRDSIATIVLEQKEERSFRDMHVLTHTSLIVVVQTVEDTVDIDTCMGSYTSSTASIIDASSILQQKHSSPVNGTGGSIGPRSSMGELIDLTLS